MQIIILCGSPGAGKTTHLQRLIADAAAGGRSVGGVFSPAVFEGIRRVGYDLVDLWTGSRRPLARLRSGKDVPATVGEYVFDEAAIREGNAALAAAMRGRVEVLAIDEVGPLEFRGGGWAPALECALRESSPAGEMILTIRPSLADELPERFPSLAWRSARRIELPAGPRSP